MHSDPCKNLLNSQILNTIEVYGKFYICDIKLWEMQRLSKGHGTLLRKVFQSLFCPSAWSKKLFANFRHPSVHKAPGATLIPCSSFSRGTEFKGNFVFWISVILNLKYTNPARGILDFCKQKFCRPLPCSQGAPHPSEFGMTHSLKEKSGAEMAPGWSLFFVHRMAPI